MIKRIWTKCLGCSGAISARVQVGHELTQPVAFACPHCGTDLHLTLILDEPPNIKVRWDENCEEGQAEGMVVNIGAGFVISRDKLHLDKYFPSFESPRPDLRGLVLPEGEGPFILDSAIALGTLPYAADSWRQLQQALRFRRTAQKKNEEARLDEFFGTERKPEETLEFSLFTFLMRFMAESGDRLLKPLVDSLKKAHSMYPSNYLKLIAHYSKDLKEDRFEAYSELFSEYFRAYGEFSQTLIYARNAVDLPSDPVATSSDFERTKMYYGNAFELLGSHLDFVAALNNVLEGRAFDQMNAMTLKHYRGINKANRTACFASNVSLSLLVAEYDSTIRNASHHRWFKLDSGRSKISFRSGGTGALNQMSYAEYLLRCNTMTLQIMTLASLELLALKYAGISL